jgi:hypothetical protein
MPIVTIGANTTDTFSGVDDTFVASDDPTTPKSGVDDLGVSKYAVGQHAHGIIRFPGLSNLPSGITVTTARIHLNILFLSISAGYTITARRVLRSINFAQATWNEYSTGNAWQTLGGLGNLDRDNTATLASLVMTGSEAADTYVQITHANLAAAVQAFCNGVISDLTIHLERTDGQDDEEFLAFKQSSVFEDGALPFLYVDYSLGGTVVTRTAEDTLALIDQYVYGIRRYRQQLDLTEISEGPTDRYTVSMADSQDSILPDDANANFMIRNRRTEEEVTVTDDFIKVLSSGQTIITRIAEDTILVSWGALYNLYRNRAGEEVVLTLDQNAYNALRNVNAASLVELIDTTVLRFIRIVVAADVLDVIDSLNALFIGITTVDVSLVMIGFDQPNIILGGYVI